MNILVIGSGAREHAMARAFARSEKKPALFCCGSTRNPGILALTQAYWCGNICHPDSVLQQAQAWQIDLAIVGPEAPLQQGIVDVLEAAGIATVGPKQALARIETSKSFARSLLQKYQISGSPAFQTFDSLDGVKAYLNQLGEGRYVIKADGLMGGKGVRVAGDHLHSVQEAYQFCQALNAHQLPFLIEEKLMGQEFSMLCLTDGETVVPMPLVQDHKRAFVQDQGPNTGGMGSYSDQNHSLPFLTSSDVLSAYKMTQAVLSALCEECGEPYKGILYGSFMATKSGVQLIEYNARFGDPEAMNLLSILESDFSVLCQALAAGKLARERIFFKPLATVCKYAVPFGYPDQPLKNRSLDVSRVENPEQLYFASVEQSGDQLLALGSRAVAVVGIAPNLVEAERLAEKEIAQIQGQLFHREDIGKADFIHRRIHMMKQLRQKQTIV